MTLLTPQIYGNRKEINAWVLEVSHHRHSRISEVSVEVYCKRLVSPNSGPKPTARGKWQTTAGVEDSSQTSLSISVLSRAKDSVA